jgi:hypothetical protein
MPQRIEGPKADAELFSALREAGLGPELIYAWQRTGRLVTQENRHLLSAAELAEWQAAIEEYRQLQRTGKFN